MNIFLECTKCVGSSRSCSEKMLGMTRAGLVSAGPCRAADTRWITKLSSLTGGKGRWSSPAWALGSVTSVVLPGFHPQPSAASSCARIGSLMSVWGGSSMDLWVSLCPQLCRFWASGKQTVSVSMLVSPGSWTISSSQEHSGLCPTPSCAAPGEPSGQGSRARVRLSVSVSQRCLFSSAWCPLPRSHCPRDFFCFPVFQFPGPDGKSSLC